MLKLKFNRDIVIGKQAFISSDEEATKKIALKYGRDPGKTRLKVFYGNPLKENETLKDALWGDNPRKDQPRLNCKLLEASKIQNIGWCHNICPRIYSVFEAELEYENKKDRVACQLTEFIEGEYGNQEDVDKLRDKLRELGKEYHFDYIKSILSYRDSIAGKIYDIHQFAFNKNYKDTVTDIYIKNGKYGKVYYQDVKELGLKGGPRKTELRIKELGLDKIDFKNKVVWDLGSAGGSFCRYAYQRGAKRVIGFDLENPTDAAFHLSNYLEMFNIDFINHDIRKNPIDCPNPDITLFLSINYHIGVPKYITERTKELIVFEDNGRESRHSTDLIEPFKSWSSNHKFIGKASDHGNKAIHHIWKK